MTLLAFAAGCLAGWYVRRWVLILKVRRTVKRIAREHQARQAAAFANMRYEPTATFHNLAPDYALTFPVGTGSSLPAHVDDSLPPS